MVTFLIMFVTIVTGTLDLTTPYNTDNSMVGLTLFLAQFTQLMARLVVFGSILSMEKESQRTSAGRLVILTFFVGSYLATCVWYWLCDRLDLFHAGGAKYRMRIASAVRDGYSQGTIDVNVDGDVANGDDDDGVSRQQPWGGLDVLNMQRASRFELYLLRTHMPTRFHSLPLMMGLVDMAIGRSRYAVFPFLNMFCCTDKNLCTPPTSKATFILSFYRILEACFACAVLVPIFGAGIDRDEDGRVDEISAFQFKSFIAVYISLLSFTCLLAAAAAEKVCETIAQRKAAGLHSTRTSNDLEPESEQEQEGSKCAAASAACSVCSHWKSSQLYLYFLVFIAVLIIGFSVEILYSVYLIGDEGARRCRSVVLLTLLMLVYMSLVCLRLAAGSSKLRLFGSTLRVENGAWFVLVGCCCAGSLLLGMRNPYETAGHWDEMALGEPEAAIDDWNPFKQVASRCHPAESWTDRLLTPRAPAEAAP